MGEEWTQIKVKKETRKALFELGKKGESYDTIIRRLLKKSEQEKG